MLKEITFCTKCGQNFHEACINQWAENRQQTERQPTCPMCRGEWNSNPSITHLQLQETLEADAVQTYLTWLYSSTVRISPSISRTDDTFNTALLQCWAVSTAVDDTFFRDAVVHTFFAEAQAHFWSTSIQFAFEERRGSDEMRCFVADVFLTRTHDGWFESESARWPGAFVRALADRCLECARSGRKMGSLEDVRAAYLGARNEVDAIEVVDLVSDDDADDVPMYVFCRSRQPRGKTRVHATGPVNSAVGTRKFRNKHRINTILRVPQP